MTKFTQMAVIFAALTTSVALVSVDPRGRSAHAKTKNMTRDAADELKKVLDQKSKEKGPDRRGARAKAAALTPTTYYVGPAGGTSADCEAAITSKAECDEAARDLLGVGNSGDIPNPTYAGGCYTVNGIAIWNSGSTASTGNHFLQPLCKHGSSAGPPALTPSPTAVPPAASCVDSYGSATNKYGGQCERMALHSVCPWSYTYDDEDFTSDDMCCECGGGLKLGTGGGPPATSAAQATGSTVAAVGDPHMQNILGQRFDLVQPGEHILIQIPRGVSASDALLRVTADAKHEGGACSDMYFKTLNITGLWVSAQQKDGYMYTAGAPQPVVGWRRFGKVEVKVAWGHTLGGVEYLNFMVRHLTRVGQDVGGLLGMDDYTQAAKRDPSCGSATLVQLYSAPQEASFAMADM